MAKMTFDYPQSSALVGKMLLALYEPLARILVKLRVPYSQAAELLKWVMVHEHATSMEAGGSSISELALRTGLCRKEVKKLLQAEAPISREYPRRHERVPAIIHGWLNDPRFSNEPGDPCTLQLQAGEGSFQDLVSHYGADIPHTVIARELLEAGVALNATPETIGLDVDKIDRGLPVMPNDAIWGCVMYVQDQWEGISAANGELPHIQLRGPERSLESFITGYSKEVSVDAVVEELVRAGCISIDDGTVRIINSTYIPSNCTALLESACENIGAFVSTVGHNLQNENPDDKLLQNELSFLGLTASDRRAFEKAVRQEVAGLKKRLSGTYAARQFREPGAPRVGVGTYLVRLHGGPRGFGSFGPRDGTDICES